MMLSLEKRRSPAGSACLLLMHRPNRPVIPEENGTTGGCLPPGLEREYPWFQRALCRAALFSDRVGSTLAVHRERNAAMTAGIPPVSHSPEASHTDDTIPPQLLRAIAPLHGTAMGVAWAVVCGGLLALAT